MREAPSEARRGALIILGRPDANGTLSVCEYVCLLSSPFWGDPCFGIPLMQILTRFALKTCPRRRPPTGPTFGTRDSQISKGSSYQKVFKNVFCRHLSPSYTYGDFQTTGGVVESKKSHHTPVGIFKLPVLSWAPKNVLTHLWGFSNYRCCADGDKWRQTCRLGHVWRANSSGIWIIWNQKVTVWSKRRK